MDVRVAAGGSGVPAQEILKDESLRQVGSFPRTSSLYLPTLLLAVSTVRAIDQSLIAGGDLHMRWNTLARVTCPASAGRFWPVQLPRTQRQPQTTCLELLSSDGDPFTRVRPLEIPSEDNATQDSVGFLQNRFRNPRAGREEERSLPREPQSRVESAERMLCEADGGGSRAPITKVQSRTQAMETREPLREWRQVSL